MISSTYYLGNIRTVDNSIGKWSRPTRHWLRLTIDGINFAVQIFRSFMKMGKTVIILTLSLITTNEKCAQTKCLCCSNIKHDIKTLRKHKLRKQTLNSMPIRRNYRRWLYWFLVELKFHWFKKGTSVDLIYLYLETTGSREYSWTTGNELLERV